MHGIRTMYVRVRFPANGHAEQSIRELPKIDGLSRDCSGSDRLPRGESPPMSRHGHCILTIPTAKSWYPDADCIDSGMRRHPREQEIEASPSGVNT